MYGLHRHYYRHDPHRVACCTANVHALLHVADGIRKAGPVWVYWAFAMERYCGRLGRVIKSRRFPWPSLDNYIEMDALLTQIKYAYHLDQSDDLDVEPRGSSNRTIEVTDADCKCRQLGYAVQMLSDLLTDPHCVLVFPFEVRQLTNAQETIIARCLTALYGKPIKTTRKVIPAAVEHAGKLRIPGGGDMIHACCMVKHPRDGRDASFVRVSTRHIDRLRFTVPATDMVSFAVSKTRRPART